MRRLLLLVPLVLAALAACDDDATNPPRAPVAAFTVGASPTAGQPVRFDASPSTDPAGGGLTYTWSFGDGGHGGTREIVHFFSQAGTYTVELTVRDGAGTAVSATRAVTVAAGPAPAGTAALEGRVEDASGAPLAGVAVTVAGTGTTATSGADGRVRFAAVPAGVALALRLERAGYATGVVRLDAVARNTSDAWFEAAMTPRAAAVPLASARDGGTVAGASGATVTFPAGALVRADGAAATGAVDVTVTPLDVTADVEAFPGAFAGVGADGTETPIASYGLMEVTLAQAGQPVRLAPGRTATVEIPVFTGGAAAGDVIPLWSLDEATGLWVQEGTGTVVASDASPTGLAMRAAVSHFSWWNIDTSIPPFIPRVRCVTPGGGGVPVPLTVGCWVRGVQAGPVPRTSMAVMLLPYERRDLPVRANTVVTIHASTAYGGVGSATVTGASGTAQDVDVEVGPPVAPPAAGDVRLVAVGWDHLQRSLASGGAGWYPSAGMVDNGAAVATDGTRWLAGGGFGGVALASSADGTTWTPVPLPAGMNQVGALAWSGTRWVAGGMGATDVHGAIATSPDGTTWTLGTLPAGTQPVRGVAWNGSYWLAGTDAPGLLRSDDNGATWQPVASPLGPFLRQMALAWNGARWVVAAHYNDGASTILSSSDGVTWTNHPTALKLAGAVAWNGSEWLVGGRGGLLRSPDGQTWTPVTLSPSTEIHGLAWTGTGWVAVGQDGQGVVLTSGTGQTWTSTSVALTLGARAVAHRRPVYPPY